MPVYNGSATCVGLLMTEWTYILLKNLTMVDCVAIILSPGCQQQGRGQRLVAYLNIKAELKLSPQIDCTIFMVTELPPNVMPFFNLG